MYDPLFNPSRSITNRVDAMQFSILATMESKCGEPVKINYDEAKKLYDFICETVGEFPNDATKLALAELRNVMQVLAENESKKHKSFLDSFFGSADAPKAPAVEVDGCFRPRIHKNQWHCVKVFEPTEDIPMAVVETKESAHLAKYSEKEKKWKHYISGKGIDNVVKYYPI